MQTVPKWFFPYHPSDFYRSIFNNLHSMTITLNGQSHSLDSEITLPALLESLCLTGKPVVVELNQEAILPRNFPQTLIRANDNLEIITLAAGG